MDRRALIGIALLAASAEAARAAPPPSGGAPANSYIPLNSLNASIMRPDGRRGVMTVEVGVDVPDEDLRLRASQSGPRLRGALSPVMQRAGAALRPGQPPDVDRLARELQQAVDQALGAQGARLLLGTVMVV